jgi:branched-chain amino acid transport system substrate-binding protein
MKTQRTGVMVALGVLLASIVWAGAVAAQQKMTVGLCGSMSGAGAAWGQALDRANRIAIDDVNARGGIRVGNAKYMLEGKTFDHAYDPSKAVEIAQRMMSVDKVAWIVTHGTTAVKPIIPFTEEKKMIVMAATAGSEIMTFQKENYTFRQILSGPETHLLFWLWAFKNHPEWKTTVGIQPDDASGWEIMKDVKEKVLPRGGVKMVAETFYRRGVTDFYPILTKLLAAKPDVFDLQNMPPADQGRVLKQAREMGYKGPFIAPIGYSYDVILDVAGPHAEGLFFGASIDPNSRFATREEKAFYDKWIKLYGPPFLLDSLFFTYGIDSVVQAIEKANSFDPDKVAKIIQTEEFNGLGRKIKMGGASVYGPPGRIVKPPFAVYAVQKGKPVMLDTTELPADY